jgi:hypothetical protein
MEHASVMVSGQGSFTDHVEDGAVLKLVTISLAAITAAGIGMSFAEAEERPTAGMVYHTTENSSLKYFCEDLDAEHIECEFTQVSIRQKAKPEDLEKRLKHLDENYAAAKKEFKDANFCKMMENLLALIDGKNVSPESPTSDEKGFMQGAPTKHRNEMREYISLLIDLCAAPSLNKFENLERSQHDKDARTCHVGSHSFKQKMYRNLSGSWTVVPKAVGDCGVVQLDYFEKAKESSNITLWNYVSRKAITNPKGEIPLLGSCKELDETVYMYEWRPRDIYLSCDYFKFSIM